MIGYKNTKDSRKINCPVKGDIESVPFTHMGLDGSVPRKCILCPYSFEGACGWQWDIKREPFSLKITQSKRIGKDALHEAFQNVISNFNPLPYSVCTMLVLEGNLFNNTIGELNEIVNIFYEGHQVKEFSFGVYPNPSLGDEVIVYIVEELEEKII